MTRDYEADWIAAGDERTLGEYFADAISQETREEQHRLWWESLGEADRRILGRYAESGHLSYTSPISAQSCESIKPGTIMVLQAGSAYWQ
jgi:hypothetical protein